MIVQKRTIPERMANRIQLTSDGHRPYLEAVGRAFGNDIDYAILLKHYGEPPEDEKRYSPPKFIKTTRRKITGNLNHAVFLHFLNYNFVKIHGSLGVTPAMEAGVTDTLWSIEDIVKLVDSN